MQNKRQAIFNEHYQLLEILGDGHTSVVYLAVDKRTNQKVVVKMIKENYFASGRHAVDRINNEFQIMKMLDSPSCVRSLDEGTSGTVVKASGRKIRNISYIMMEHVQGETLYDFMEALNEGDGIGESFSRFLMH